MTHNPLNKNCPMNELTGQPIDELMDCTCDTKPPGLTKYQKLEVIELFEELIKESEIFIAYDNDLPILGVTRAIEKIKVKYKS